MAVQIDHERTINDQMAQLNYHINNGDLQGITQAMAKWRFADEVSMLRFAIAILVSAKDNRLYTDGPDGKKTLLTPAPNLLQQDAVNNTEASDNAITGEQPTE